jgi:hypothetical protein
MQQTRVVLAFAALLAEVLRYPADCVGCPCFEEA